MWIEEVGSALLASVPSEVGETNEDDKCKFTENILPAAMVGPIQCMSTVISRQCQAQWRHDYTFNLLLTNYKIILCQHIERP